MPLHALPEGLRRCAHRQPVLVIGNTGLAFRGGQRTTYTLPGTRHTRSFCAACGSALPYTLDGLLVVPAGALTTDVDIAPSAHIFVASKAGWERKLVGTPSFDGFPM